ncbi:hypothetical protein ACLHZ0_21895 [Aeromonas salmonicida]|uniref:hypothetical protein n=1 Tax=Aeromonas salmonicida TaxID=645 RepID=UPI003D02AFDE
MLKNYDFNNTDIPLLFQYSLDYSLRFEFIKKFGRSGVVDMNEFSVWIEQWVKTPSEKESIAKFKQDIKDIAKVTALKRRIDQYKRFLRGKDTNPYA